MRTYRQKHHPIKSAVLTFLKPNKPKIIAFVVLVVLHFWFLANFVGQIIVPNANPQMNESAWSFTFGWFLVLLLPLNIFVLSPALSMHNLIAGVIPSSFVQNLIGLIHILLYLYLLGCLIGIIVIKSSVLTKKQRLGIFFLPFLWMIFTFSMYTSIMLPYLLFPVAVVSGFVFVYLFKKKYKPLFGLLLILQILLSVLGFFRVLSAFESDYCWQVGQQHASDSVNMLPANEDEKTQGMQSVTSSYRAETKCYQTFNLFEALGDTIQNNRLLR